MNLRENGPHMSLIETALNKAKKLAETGIHPVLRAPPEAPREVLPRRAPVSAPDAEVVAARTERARTLPVASVDARVMEERGVLLAVEDPAAHRSCRILRTRVQQRMRAQGWHSLAVTAVGVGDGKTLTAINLAISLARDVNTWVYLVDLDLQRPSVSSYLGMQFDKGLSDYLAGQAQFDEIIYSPGVERLAVIPNANVVALSSDVLGSPRAHELCKSLAGEVPRPIVIYDMPPLLMGDDVLKFAPNVDSTLFVVSEGVTSRASLLKANEVLQEMNLLGVVLNRSTEREGGGHYGYY